MGLKENFVDVHINDLNNAGLDFFLGQEVAAKENKQIMIHGSCVYMSQDKISNDVVVTLSPCMFNPSVNGAVLAELMGKYTGYRVTSYPSTGFDVVYDQFIGRDAILNRAFCKGLLGYLVDGDSVTISRTFLKRFTG